MRKQGVRRGRTEAQRQQHGGTDHLKRQGVRLGLLLPVVGLLLFLGHAGGLVVLVLVVAQADRLERERGRTRAPVL